MSGRILFALAVLAGLAKAGAVNADDYTVTPVAGPWLICAASYTGPEAAQLAQELVLDIRKTYRLNAYVYNRADKERREQEDLRQKWQSQMGNARFRTTRVEDQYAVLVGGYADIDAARADLDRIKKLKPSDKKLMRIIFRAKVGDEERATSRFEKEARAKAEEASYVSPFLDAFVVPNPTVRHERKAEAKHDPALKDMNADESFSLLKCKQPWTLLVAVYQGVSVIQASNSEPTFLEKMLGKSGGTLSASAQNAHSFAAAYQAAAKKFGLDVYVLHTRQGSLVTVGGFNGKDDPRLKQAEQIVTNNLRLMGQGSSCLLAQPMAIEVPRP